MSLCQWSWRRIHLLGVKWTEDHWRSWKTSEKVSPKTQCVYWRPCTQIRAKYAFHCHDDRRSIRVTSHIFASPKKFKLLYVPDSLLGWRTARHLVVQLIWGKSWLDCSILPSYICCHGRVGGLMVRTLLDSCTGRAISGPGRIIVLFPCAYYWLSQCQWLHDWKR